MSPLSPSTSGAFIKGVDASTGILLQPRGSVPRASNFLLTKRGALRVCDGTAIVNAYNNVPTPGRGKIMEAYLFAPTSVAPYYLLIEKLLDMPLGPPQNLSAMVGGSVGLNGTFYWEVTAVDGAGGETTVSNEVSASPSNQVVTLTWNIVPNAAGYNVYRGTSSGGEKLLTSPTSVQGTVAQPPAGSLTVSFSDTGYPVGSTSPPTKDTTQQTGMFATFPGISGVIPYGNSNLQAIWPADAHYIDSNIGGGSGGGGGTGGGTSGTPGSTPSGGLIGNVSFIPQMAQFVNQMMIALGNSYPPQIFSDQNTPDNAGVHGLITSISVDAYGVVTVNCTAHGLTSANVGACVFIGAPGIAGTGITDPVYYGCYITIAIPSGTSFKIRNLAAIGHGTATGYYQVNTVPIYNTFQPQFPAWVASSQYSLNSVVEPMTPNGFYYKAIAPADGGESGANEPSFPITVGATVQDGNITWQNAGAVSSAAPPPPGAAHIAVYAGALWVWNTYPINTTNGLDGPTVVRMSDINNPLSWNPVNTAFIDKDDGTDGMGLASFTITAQGIPPQGSLVLCKLRATYQIEGVFGSSNFVIQRITTDMGCISPRTLQFISGFGIGRITHLGVGIFDGVNDRLASPQVNPYLFPTNDPELADITVADANWIAVAWSATVANPPMYCCAIPIGNSGGALTRILCFDLVLKAWAIVDLPFPVSTMYQALSFVSNPVTLLGSFSDGTLQRWQAGDIQWATAASGSQSAAPVSWMVRTPTTASKSPDQRLFCRRFWCRGTVGESVTTPAATPAALLINPRIEGNAIGPQPSYLPPSGQFTAQAAVGATSDVFDAIITGTGPVTIDAVGAHVEPKPTGILTGDLV